MGIIAKMKTIRINPYLTIIVFVVVVRVELQALCLRNNLTIGK